MVITLHYGNKTISANVYKSVREIRRLQKEGLEKGQGKHLVCIYFDKYIDNLFSRDKSMCMYT